MASSADLDQADREKQLEMDLLCLLMRFDPERGILWHRFHFLYEMAYKGSGNVEGENF